MNHLSINTFGELKAAGFQHKSIKEELRSNLVQKLKKKESIFKGILGFNNTVLPDIERAILSKHNILLLGLRGQAKTRIARTLVNLLDEWAPIIAGSEVNDDPFLPISRFGKEQLANLGDAMPIEWIHRNERYVEKLATPDVSVADLIGDVDPIKAAALKLPYADERVIHFGLIPRAHRCIFVINELPDLQARIQVALFNALQEGDIQIRGFKVRMPLDIEFVFTANPEDYTNRGSIITPLKDRIESQILTHYPDEIEISKQITAQEARIDAVQEKSIYVSDILKDLVEEIAFAARKSEFVDSKSGVSARLTIAAYENLVSAAERRMLINNDKKTTARIADFWGVIPAITGKVELVYEGEQEGPHSVALDLLGKAIKKVFLTYFPDPDKLNKRDKDPYGTIKAWFAGKNHIDIVNDDSNAEYQTTLEKVAGLKKLIEEQDIPKADVYTFMELVLFALSEFNVIGKDYIDKRFSFKDLLSNFYGGGNKGGKKGGFEDDDDTDISGFFDQR